MFNKNKLLQLQQSKLQEHLKFPRIENIASQQSKLEEHLKFPRIENKLESPRSVLKSSGSECIILAEQ